MLHPPKTPCEPLISLICYWCSKAPKGQEGLSSPQNLRDQREADGKSNCGHGRRSVKGTDEQLLAQIISLKY